MVTKSEVLTSRMRCSTASISVCPFTASISDQCEQSLVWSNEKRCFNEGMSERTDVILSTNS